MILGIDIDNTITATNETVRAYLKQEYPLFEDYKLLPKEEYDLFLKKYLKKVLKKLGLILRNIILKLLLLPLVTMNLMIPILKIQLNFYKQMAYFMIKYILINPRRVL